MKAIYRIILSNGEQDTVNEPARINNGRLEVQGKFGWTPATGSLEPDELHISKAEFKPISCCIAQMHLIDSLKKFRAY